MANEFFSVQKNKKRWPPVLHVLFCSYGNKRLLFECSQRVIMNLAQIITPNYNEMDPIKFFSFITEYTLDTHQWCHGLKQRENNLYLRLYQKNKK